MIKINSRFSKKLFKDMFLPVKMAIIRFTTWRTKLLNAYWLRQRVFSLNLGNCLLKTRVISILNVTRPPNNSTNFIYDVEREMTWVSSWSMTDVYDNHRIELFLSMIRITSIMHCNTFILYFKITFFFFPFFPPFFFFFCVKWIKSQQILTCSIQQQKIYFSLFSV